MAENKASFILYSDLIHTVSKLPDEIAGKLLKHILEYVNDKDPQTDDLLLQVVFEPIKLQLKRDLRSWEKTLEEKSEGGKLGNLKRWHPDLYNQVVNKQIDIETALLIASNRKVSHTDTDQSHPIASVAVNVTVTDNDTVNVNENYKEDDGSIEPSTEKLSAYKLCTEYWLKVLHPSWTFTAVHGKTMKTIIGKIEKMQKQSEKEITPETTATAFQFICSNLPDFFIDKDLQVINSKFNEIIEQIKNKSNGTNKNKQQSKYR